MTREEALRIVAEAAEAWAKGEPPDLTDVDLTNVDLTGADLTWAVLHEATLRWADLHRAVGLIRPLAGRE